MKKIFAILALFLAFTFTANAQDAEKIIAASQADAATLGKVVTIPQNSKKAVQSAFYYKHKANLQENLTAEQKNDIAIKTEELLTKALGEAQIKKLKSNTELYNKLIK